MTYKPDDVQLKCPLGFTVKINEYQRTEKECGHHTCFPSSCEFLRRLGLEVDCPEIRKK